MDNYHSYMYFEATKRMIKAMGMDAENKQRLANGESIAYSDIDFFNLADEPLDY